MLNQVSIHFYPIPSSNKIKSEEEKLRTNFYFNMRSAAYRELLMIKFFTFSKIVRLCILAHISTILLTDHEHPFDESNKWQKDAAAIPRKTGFLGLSILIATFYHYIPIKKDLPE